MPRSNRLAPATVLFLLLLAFHALFQLGFFAQISFMPDALLEATGVPPDLASNLSGLLAVAARRCL